MKKLLVTFSSLAFAIAMFSGSASAQPDQSAPAASGEQKPTTVAPAANEPPPTGDSAATTTDGDPAAAADSDAPAANTPDSAGDAPKAAAPAKKKEKKLPALTDPTAKSFVGKLKAEAARKVISDKLAVALEGAADKIDGEPRSYFQVLVAANKTWLFDAISTQLNGMSDEAAASAAGTYADLLTVPMTSSKQLAAMRGVAENCLDTVGAGEPFVVPPGVPAEHSDASFWMPPVATDEAKDVDWMFYGILALSAICFIGITVATLFLAWRYRNRPGHKAEPSSSHNDAMEITWTVIPSIIVVIIFVLGWKGFMNMMTPPRHALEIQVVGQKWNWSFAYPDTGGFADNVLHVPVDTPVRLVMRSEDVLHDLDIPAFRIKADVIPRRYTKLWFKANRTGIFRVYCAEYCGTGHSDMKTWVQVHPSGGYEKFLEKAEELQKGMDPVKLGKLMYDKKGCGQCHSVDGSGKAGPTFKGSFGTKRNFAGGGSGVMDENYIRESILEPKALVVAGYNPVMPTFKGKLKDFQIDGLIAYIKSLK